MAACASVFLPGPPATSECPTFHEDLHQEVWKLSQREIKVDNFSPDEIVDELTELTRRVIYDGQEADVLELLLFMDASLNISFLKLQCQNVTLEDLESLTRTLHEVLKEIGPDMFTGDIDEDVPRHCILSIGIDGLTAGLLKTISDCNLFVKATFDQHVSNIEACCYSLIEYSIIVNLHNVFTILYEIYQRRNSATGFGESQQNEAYTMELGWNGTRDAILLVKRNGETSAECQAIRFHPSFFGLLVFGSEAAPREWLTRMQSTNQLGRETDSCTICLEHLSTHQEAAVLSSCDHIFHVQCLESWLKSKRR